MKINRFAAGLAACLLVNQAAAADLPHAGGGGFSDVPADAWYADAVQTAYAHGLMRGTGGDAFQPEGRMTVAEAWMLAARLHSLSHGGDGSFPAGATWYAGAQAYLQEQGILQAAFETLKSAQGYTDEYPLQPGDTANRLYLADLFAQALPAEDLPAINQIHAIPDFPEDAAPAGARRLLALYNAGVLTGNDEWGSFGPQDDVTRAETAAVAARLAEPSQRKAFAVKEMPFTLTRFDNANPGYPITGMSMRPSEGLIQVSVNSEADGALSGYADLSGKIVIPPVYDWISLVKDGYVGVSKNGRRSVLDAKGSLVFHAPTDPSSRGHTYGATSGGHGLFLLSSEDGKWGVADRTGKIVLPVSYGGVSVLSDNLIAANRNWGPYALFDASGKQLSEAVYSLTQHEFSDGRLLVQRDGKFGFLDESGREVIPARYHYAAYDGFSSGIALVTPDEGGRAVYIDTAGNVVIDAEPYVTANQFHEGLASVWFQNGAAMVCQVLQPDGTPWKPEFTAGYDSIDIFLNGAAVAYKDGLAGLVGADGTERIAPQYNEFQRFGPLFGGRMAYGAPFTFYDKTGAKLSTQPDWRYEDRLAFSGGYVMYDHPESNLTALFAQDGRQLTPYIFFGAPDFGDGDAAPVSISGCTGFYLLRRAGG